MPPPRVEPGHVTHPIYNRAQRRVTSLIRPTPLPLRHANPSLKAIIIQELSCRREKALCLCMIIDYMQHCYGTIRFVIYNTDVSKRKCGEKKFF